MSWRRQHCDARAWTQRAHCSRRTHSILLRGFFAPHFCLVIRLALVLRNTHNAAVAAAPCNALYFLTFLYFDSCALDLYLSVILVPENVIIYISTLFVNSSLLLHSISFLWRSWRKYTHEKARNAYGTHLDKSFWRIHVISTNFILCLSFGMRKYNSYHLSYFYILCFAFLYSVAWLHSFSLCVSLADCVPAAYMQLACVHFVCDAALWERRMLLPPCTQWYISCMIYDMHSGWDLSHAREHASGIISLSLSYTRSTLHA